MKRVMPAVVHISHAKGCDCDMVMQAYTSFHRARNQWSGTISPSVSMAVNAVCSDVP